MVHVDVGDAAVLSSTAAVTGDRRSGVAQHAAGLNKANNTTDATR
jgi:hypothetical protein